MAPFRDAYWKLHEFRSLIPGARMIALTATATKSTRKTIFDVLRMKNPHIIFESPNKENITYSVERLPKDFKIENYFSWLVEDLKQKKKECDRTIIYCQTINQCSLLYAMLRGLLGKDIMTPDSNGPLLEMLHSCTPVSNKQNILQSFTEENGNIRVLIATIAFGMGIDCKAVRKVIHFGPSKNIESYAQETGRAGRDGAPSSAFLLFNGVLLRHVEGDIRSYIESNECRRSVLLNHFQAEYTPITPKHMCCDICAATCQCEMTDCTKFTTYPNKDAITKEYVPPRSREVSQLQQEQVENMLKVYHKSLVTQLMDTVPHGNLNTLTDVSFLLGFSDIQINQVMDNLKHLFTLNDICTLIEIWDSKHSKKILHIIAEVFEDVSDTLVLDSDEDPMDREFILNDWEIFLKDDELLILAAENVFQESHIATGYHELSQLAEDSYYEQNVSDSNTSMNVGIPDAIHEALSRISPDP